MKKNKKGFTLVELLAVIVILIVILLLALTRTKKSTQDAKLNSIKASAISYVKTLKDLVGEDLIDQEQLDTGFFTPTTLESYGLRVSGTKPDDGFFFIENYNILNYCLQYGDYYITDVEAKNPLKEGKCPDPNVNVEFAFTGAEQEYEAKVAGYYKLEAWGAQGGGRQISSNDRTGYGGMGGYSAGTVYLNTGDILYIYVGGQGGISNGGLAPGGWNGGGASWCGEYANPSAGGGGATDFRISGNTLYHRIVVAGGGGGGGETRQTGGCGGGTTSCGGAVSGSTQTSGGEGSAFGNGANTRRDGGAGGGGWYGGGASGGSQSIPTSNDSFNANAGSGGSGFVFSAAPDYLANYAVSLDYLLTDAVTIPGNQDMPSYNSDTTVEGNGGNGYAKVTFLHS